MRRNIVVFISGQGTNLQAIVNAVNENVLNANIVGVVSNNEDAEGLSICEDNNIKALVYPYKKDKSSREEYDEDLANRVKKWNFDLIVLAGWMHVFTKSFLSQFPDIINLHPALPGKFPGHTAIKDAYEAYKNGSIENTGIMVHRVIEEIDAGDIIGTTEVPIYKTDTLEDLSTRIKYFEKPLLITSIQKAFSYIKDEYPLVHSGKVREMYDIGYDMLCISHSNRLSAFDRHICDIPDKGHVLSQSSAMWFRSTSNIVPNHMLYDNGNVMIVKKCIPFDVEVVVRGFIAGNTATSLWTHYSKGERVYCGIEFPDDLEKNQRIPNVITPTTKGVKDVPISAEQVVSMGYMTEDEWKYVSKKALELFEIG